MQLRNIGIVAHVDAGKTTTTEQMLFQSGRLKSLGRVDEGTAHTDWLGVERDRGISVRAAVTRLEWQGVTINLIDTPGHIDFSSEVERALRVLDGVILVVSAIDGVQAHTETLWHALREMKIPTLIYVNKMDRLGVELPGVIEELKRVLHPSMVAIQVVNEGGLGFSCVFPIFTEKEGDSNFVKSSLDDCFALLAEHSEPLLTAYVEGAPPDLSLLQTKLIAKVHQAEVFPVLFGASLKGIGIAELLDAVVQYIPAPQGEMDGDLSGVVFKIERDKLHGKVAYVRLFNGSLKNRDTVQNVTQALEEKVTQIRQIDVQMHRDTGLLTAGDVGAVYGMSQARIGDILGHPHHIPNLQSLSVPLLTAQVLPDNSQDYIALVEAMQELDLEDPALSMQWLKEERELHIQVMGSIQLEVLQQLVAERFCLAIQFSQPSVIYKETPKQTAIGYVAYTMPKPCWAILHFLIEPGPRGSGVKYTATVRTEDLLQRYQNEVERRVPEALQQGLFGFEVTDIQITLVEGQHHVFHTHPLDFVIATPMGLMDGLKRAGSQLLEPILQFRLSVPEEFGGRVLSELSQMRAEYENPDIKLGRFTVEGTIPLATSMDYPIQLGIRTGGRGVFTTRFLTYRDAPSDVQATRTRRGVNPLDTSKYILSVRNAL
jgi:ribosomal protection tetracycline resistance protein